MTKAVRLQLISLILLFFGRGAAAQTGYTFTIIDPPNSSGTNVNGINNLGSVVGSFSDTTGFHGFVWNSGNFTTLNFPGTDIATTPFGINDLGEIVGEYVDFAARREHGFIFRSNTFTPIDFPTAINTSLFGINNSDASVGRWSAGDNGFGFELSNGSFTSLPFVPSAINSSGDMVGSTNVDNSVLSHNGVLTPIAFPGSFSTSATSINNLGVIAGTYFGSDFHRHGFILKNNTYTTLDYPGASETFLAGINDFEIVTGEAFGPISCITGICNSTKTVFVATPATAPLAPQNLSAIVGNGTVYLFWDRIGGPVDDYVIDFASDTGDKGTLIFKPPTVELMSGVLDQPTAVLLVGGTNGVTYLFQVSTEKNGVRSEAAATVTAKPNSLSGSLVPPKPSNPILFLHGYRGDGRLRGATFGPTFDFIINTLHWHFGGQLYHDPKDSLETKVDLAGTWPPSTLSSATVDKKGDFFSGSFGDATATYNDNRGLSHQGDEVGAFIEKLVADGVQVPAVIVAHSNGGLAARDYLTRSPENASHISALTTYGTPHRGADLGVLPFLIPITSTSRTAKTDAAFFCVGSTINYITPFLQELNSAARELPESVTYSTIMGNSQLFGRGQDCHSSAWDGLVPLSSADLTQTGVLPAGAKVRRFVTHHSHIGQGGDFSTILCALNPACVQFTVLSPVDITVTDPDGNRISPALTEIPGASYDSTNDSPGHDTTTVTIPFPEGGSYRITPTPKKDATPGDTFTIELRQDGSTQAIAKDVRIGDIPANGYAPVVDAFPIAIAGADQVLECSAPKGTNAVLNGTGSYDPDGDPVTFEWADEQGSIIATTAIANVFVPLGTHVFKLTVRDGRGGFGVSYVTVKVQDTTAPALDVSVSPNILTPPNHKFVPISASVSAQDACDPNPQFQLVSITSSEPDPLGFVSGADFGTPDVSFFLRAERNGELVGRTYEVQYAATDSSGNSATKTVIVIVPHDDRNQGGQLP